MTHERFSELLEELDKLSNDMLTKEICDNFDDVLHNFRIGACIDNSTIAQTIWHYWKKYLIELINKIQNDNWPDQEEILKIISTNISYLKFILCTANDNEYKEDCFTCANNGLEDICQRCQYNYIPNTLDYELNPNLYKEKKCLK